MRTALLESVAIGVIGMTFVQCNIVAAAVLALGALAGCAGDGAAECSTGADCESGFCRADRTCAPPADPDGGVGADAADAPGADGAAAGCQPNHDGIITRAEVPVAAGRTARYRVALDASVSTAGEDQDGTRHWNLAGQLSGDQDVQVVLGALDGTWYADEFEGATYSTRLSQTAALLGVFEAGDEALRLRGVVSPTAGATRTQLGYDPPVPVLRFPLELGATWKTTATVSGLAQGVYSYYTETYESTVDARGTLATPYGTFPVLRVRVELRRTVGAVVVTSRTYAFVAECYGTVAAVVSEDYESELEFERAAEVRRLAP